MDRVCHVDATAVIGRAQEARDENDRVETGRDRREMVTEGDKVIVRRLGCMLDLRDGG